MKEYGKLTENQFRRFVRQLPEFRREYAGMEESIRSASPEKLREVLGDGIWWAPLYELSLTQCLALLFYVLGEIDRLKIIAQLPDPQEHLLREIETGKELEWDGGLGGAFTKGDLIALAMALQRNVPTQSSSPEHLAAAAKRIENGRKGNVVALPPRFSHTGKTVA
jgi:hypothetical protein